MHLNSFQVDIVRPLNPSDLLAAASDAADGHGSAGSAIYLLPSMYNHSCGEGQYTVKQSGYLIVWICLVYNVFECMKFCGRLWTSAIYTLLPITNPAAVSAGLRFRTAALLHAKCGAFRGSYSLI